MLNSTAESPAHTIKLYLAVNMKLQEPRQGVVGWDDFFCLSYFICKVGPFYYKAMNAYRFTTRIGKIHLSELLCLVAQYALYRYSTT